MASENRFPAPGINSAYDGLREQENFFALVRHYERHLNFLAKQQEPASEEAYVYIGEDGPPSHELIRFRSVKTPALSVNNVKKVVAKESGYEHYEFMVSFMGLLGSAGVLPQHYTRLSLERIKQGDSALVDFIGLFEHRLISLFYKAWGKYKHAIAFENAKKIHDDPFSQVIKSFSSFSRGPLTQLYYAGHFSKTNRSLSNLVSLVKEMLGEKVSAKSMVGRWLPINVKDRCVIGSNGYNHRLGDGVIVGKRYWDIQSKIEIVVDGITMERYRELEHGKPLYQLLTATINSYVPIHINVFLRFIVNCQRVELSQLDGKLQLSQNLWLASKYKNHLVAVKQVKR